MKLSIGFSLSLAVLSGLPLAVSAQTTPCVSCAIARQNAAIAAATNRLIVQQQLQADLQSRLATQQATLQNQALLNTLMLRSSLDANDAAIRQVLLQEQLNLLQLQTRSGVKPPAKKKPKP